jgi:acetolactate synthase-1/2/3 large subunit
LTSGGLGTMGYAIPAASGVCFGAGENPETVIAVCGDGSFQMAMGELGVIAEHQLPLKLVVMNNGKLGMVRQQQHDNYGAKHHYSGTDINFNVPFVELAEVYGFKAYRATTDEAARQAMTEALKQPGPTLVECTVDPDFIRF